MKATLQRIVKGKLRAPSEIHLEPGEPAAAEPAPGTVMFWAAQKGHIPQPRTGEFRGEIHRGPHVDVVRTQGLDDKGKVITWPRDMQVTEDQYDAATKRAYSIAVSEDQIAQGERLKAANARAEKQKNKQPTQEGE